jgi:acyl carrier protein
MVKVLVDELKAIIADELDVNLKVDEIDENISLFEDGLGLDSVSLIELISLIENHFRFDFNDSDLNPEFFSNLNVLANFISSKLQARTLKVAT